MVFRNDVYRLLPLILNSIHAPLNTISRCSDSMSLWYSSRISFLFVCPTTMKTLLDRLPLSQAGVDFMKMVRCLVYCRRSLCLSSTTPSASPCTDQRAILSTYHTYSSVPAGKRAATIPVKVIPVAPWCCSVSRINAFNWAVSSPGALAARRPISRASIPASLSSETGSIRFYNFSRIVVVYACVLCLILSKCPALESTSISKSISITKPNSNSSSNSCFGYDLLTCIQSLRITQATISVIILLFSSQSTHFIHPKATQQIPLS